VETGLNKDTCFYSFRNRATGALSSGAVRHYILLWSLYDNGRVDLYRSLRRNTLAIPVRAILHARKCLKQHHVCLDFHGHFLEYPLSWRSSEAGNTYKVLLLLSVPLAGLSTRNVLVDQHTDHSYLAFHEYLSTEANAEAYYKD
jgi:hypothetical protein